MAIDYDKPVPDKKPKRARAAKEKPHKITIEELFKTAKDLGFSISIPTSAEDEYKQEAALVKLGFSDTRAAKPIRKANTLRGYLHASHRVGTECYGPGELELPESESDLFRSLLHQDQLCIRSQMDTTQYTNTSRCFFVQPGRSSDGKNKFAKVEVT